MWLLSNRIKSKGSHRRPSKFLGEFYLKRYRQLEMKGTWRVRNEKRHLDTQVSVSWEQSEKTTWLHILVTFHKNGKMTKRPKPKIQRVELRVIENYSQTSTRDISKELETFGGISELLPLHPFLTRSSYSRQLLLIPPWYVWGQITLL